MLFFSACFAGFVNAMLHQDIPLAEREGSGCIDIQARADEILPRQGEVAREA